MTLLEELKIVLKKDERLVSDNKLLKNKIVELALKLDKNLIKLLLNNKKIRKHFFIEFEGTLIFDKEKLMKFIDNKEFLPDSYTAFKINIGLTADRRYIAKSEEVVLSWPYKDCILEGGQRKEDEKRKEIFYNEILAPDEIDRLLDPKVFTDFKGIDAEGEHKITEIKHMDNLIIKGNSLLVLHSIKKKYRGKIKCIYLDPPFNTGSDSFKYNDTFNHSTWLTFMKNRLEIAYELLSKDGAIFVHLDDNEHAYTKIIMDEIFKKSNFLSSIAVQSSTPSGFKTVHKDKTIIKQKDHILVYKKDTLKITPQYLPQDKWDTHYSKYFDRTSKILYKLEDILKEKGILTKGQKLKDVDLNNPDFTDFYMEHQDNIYQTQPNMPAEFKKISRESRDVIIEYGEEDNKQYAINGRRLAFLSSSFNKLEDGSMGISKLLCDIWTDIDFQNTQNEGGTNFPSGKKPERLIMRILNLVTDKDDIVLDFFLGSGTTAAVAHKMGRKYIGIEQMDYGDDSPVNRLKNVIKGDQSGISNIVGWKAGGSFVYFELKELNEVFIQRILKAPDKKELLKTWKEAKQNGFLSYRVDEKLFDDNIDEFKKLSLKEQKKILLGCLELNKLYINYSEIEDAQYEVSKEDIELNKKFYGDF